MSGMTKEIQRCQEAINFTKGGENHLPLSPMVMWNVFGMAYL